MKIKELIQILKELDPESDIVIEVLEDYSFARAWLEHVYKNDNEKDIVRLKGERE